MKKYVLVILLFPIICFTQTHYIDSLSEVTYNHTSANDSIQMFNYVLLFRAHVANKTNDSIQPITNKALEFAKEKNNPEYLTTAYNLKGVYYKSINDFNKALKTFNIANRYSKQIKDTIRIHYIVNYNLWHSHLILGNLDSSFHFAKNSYQVALSIKNINFQSTALSSIAQYYINIGSFPNAIEYLNKSLKLAISIQDTNRIISAKLNIGKVLVDNEKQEEMIAVYEQLLIDYDSTTLASKRDLINLNLGAANFDLKRYEQSLRHTYNVLNSNSNIQRGLAYGNIGETYLTLLKSGIKPSEIPLLKKINLEHSDKKNKELILDIISTHFNKSYEEINALDATNYKIHPLKNMGEFYNYTNEHEKALKVFKEAWEITASQNMLNEQKKIAKQIYEQYKHLNKSSEALLWHEKLVEISDSLNLSDTQQEVGKQLALFEYTNIQLKDSLEQIKKDAIQILTIDQQNKDIKNERLKKYYLYGGLLIAVLLLLFLYRRFEVTKKQNRLIQLQKAAMEEKQIELSKTHLAIKDSINYSKRIQKSIFPSKDDITCIFPDNFIIFKPKDIVSGDFYWCIEIDNKKIIVVGDCTGHGVPGAFMTIIGINMLKEILHDGIYESAKILNAINHKLKDQLSKNNDSINDGMDLGVCVIDNSIIEFSGAHFPLYHQNGNQLVEYKGTNIFLGNYNIAKEIKTHYIPYKKNDLIYLVTDGFPDQKGGKKGKKYYYKPLKNLLQNNSSQPLNKQKEILETEFNNWIEKGNTSQVDDVTIVGIKL